MFATEFLTLGRQSLPHVGFMWMARTIWQTVPLEECNRLSYSTTTYGGVMVAHD